jgi:hypothetical protein
MIHGLMRLHGYRSGKQQRMADDRQQVMFHPLLDPKNPILNFPGPCCS